MILLFIFFEAWQNIMSQYICKRQRLNTLSTGILGLTRYPYISGVFNSHWQSQSSHAGRSGAHVFPSHPRCHIYLVGSHYVSGIRVWFYCQVSYLKLGKKWSLTKCLNIPLIFAKFGSFKILDTDGLFVSNKTCIG